MPTIDQLESVVVASDEDMLPVSQNGISRRVSRSQLLAGTQTTLTIAPGILGRASPGLGPPQQITVGGGLSLTDGVLSGAPRYSATNLPTSSKASLTDLVPIGQDGQDNSVSVRALLSVPGIDVSNQVVNANIGLTRRLGEWLGDTVAVEAFGALGDGMTDDTASINLAIASGRPVLFGPRIYRVDGQWNVQLATTLVGTAGLTVLRRVSQAGGAWINVTGPSISFIGIVFDAGSLDGDSWSVLITPSCTQTLIRNCCFVNATGVTLGTGLTIQARDGLSGYGSAHRISNCSFQNNMCHGIWVQATSNVDISHCQASHNGGYGICLDFNDPKFTQTVRQSSVTNSRCWRNTRGISVGNYNATNSEPPIWGLENPDALDIIVAQNICSNNSAYGIAVSGKRIHVRQNQIIIEDQTGIASGILCNSSTSTLADNSIVGPGSFGIDAGGSADTSITSNAVANCETGINAGGSTRVYIAENKLLNNARAVTLFQVETDGAGTNFGLACCNVWITENLIQLEAGNGGIFLFDGPEQVEITSNRFFFSDVLSIKNLCWAHTDSVFINGNTLNGSDTYTAEAIVTGGLVQISLPDVIDRAVVGASIMKVDAVQGVHQSVMAGQVSFVRVTNGGQGYSQAKIIIAGLGSGAIATAYLKDGVIIGIALDAGGSGYDPATTSASIVGDGTGATLKIAVGLPVPQDRRLSLRCLSPVHFTQTCANGIQYNWTKTDITVAAGSEVNLVSVSGQWQAISFENIDYVQPGGDGSISIRSTSGDISLNTPAEGSVRFRSDTEQSGFLTCFGRGSPEGIVAAPPGSDYRNLDGGLGATLWLKSSGTGNLGWSPIT